MKSFKILNFYNPRENPKTLPLVKPLDLTRSRRHLPMPVVQPTVMITSDARPGRVIKVHFRLQRIQFLAVVVDVRLGGVEPDVDLLVGLSDGDVGRRSVVESGEEGIGVVELQLMRVDDDGEDEDPEAGEDNGGNGDEEEES